MKKILTIILVLVWLINISFSSWEWWDETQEIYPTNENSIIDTDWLDDPLRDGTRSAVNWVQWIIDENTETGDSNQNNVLKYVSKWINYFLWLLWLIVTIYIIKEWISIVVAWNNENIQKESMKDIRNYIIALIWIWVSYLIINLVFHFINVTTI